MKCRVVIIGGGALGKCLAVLLSDQANIIVYERNPATRRALRRGRLSFYENNGAKHPKLQTIASLVELQDAGIDVLIFATKIMDLRGAVAEAAGLKPRCIFFPQNGIFDLTWVKSYFPQAGICRGTTTMACQDTGPGQVKLFYRGDMYIGGEAAPQFAPILRKCGINTKAYRDSAGPVWAKLIFSAVMNPLPVITGQGYDVLRKNMDIWKLVQKAVQEGRMVAKTLRIRLAFDPLQLIRRVREGDLKKISHRGTICQDISAGRPTELEFITGALIRQARKAGVKTPALDWIFSKARASGA